MVFFSPLFFYFKVPLVELGADWVTDRLHQPLEENHSPCSAIGSQSVEWPENTGIRMESALERRDGAWPRALRLYSREVKNSSTPY